MSSTNFTTHYSIPLPLGTDLTTPMDYNDAAEAVDSALFAAETDAGNASEAAAAAVTTANAAADAVDTVAGDLSQEKAKIVALQTRMTNAENEIDDVRVDSSDMITAYNEPTATASHAYAIGDFFIYNNTLYKATAVIAIGATIVPDTNCETTNVSTELIEIKSALMPKTGLGSDYYHTPTSTWTIAANDEQTVDQFTINAGDSGNYLVNFIAEWQADCKYILRINSNIVSVVSSGSLAEVLHLTGGDVLDIRVQNNSSNAYTVSNDSTKFRMEAFKLTN